ncbi:oxidoreductase [Shouchella miscanthi]|uniref:Oxidoreductase n=1 Tax=Shouchella miscanthi TaxID=2598861 RepID=A0ABU6NI52_9BACI|nr:oxidoreductase [Shouchella miscanthi]MED4127745.1 oxidoreductase [Shouchella miscanthi]
MKQTALITGATSGIGLETAKYLLASNYRIIIASRNKEKGEAIVTLLRPYRDVSFSFLDLGNLSSIQAFSESVQTSRLDLLINNAGVMIPPYELTIDGFERQFGTNHLGHFALTGSLLPLLTSTPQSRIVTITSIAAIKGTIQFAYSNGEHDYSPMTYYRQSKYANFLFARELDRRLKIHRKTTISVACHPGLAYSNLLSRGSGKKAHWFIRSVLPYLVQSAKQGAASTCYAATCAQLNGGEWIGPSGYREWYGKPKSQPTGDAIFDKHQAKSLWSLSEKQTGIYYLS